MLKKKIRRGKLRRLIKFNYRMLSSRSISGRPKEWTRRTAIHNENAFRWRTKNFQPERVKGSEKSWRSHIPLMKCKQIDCKSSIIDAFMQNAVDEIRKFNKQMKKGKWKQCPLALTGQRDAKQWTLQGKKKARRTSLLTVSNLKI